MANLIHFSKVFATLWAVVEAFYIVAVFRWGFDFSVGWVGHSPPPMWVIRLLFYVWPAAPAFLAAMIWELTRWVLTWRATPAQHP